MKIFDPTYISLSKKYGIDFILEAGFFEKQSHPDLNLDLLCTPLAFLNLEVHNPAILLATGAMAPMHQGHLQMLETAKSAVEDAGFTVAGGFIAPDHDEYVGKKFSNAKEFDIFRRNQIVAQTIQNHDWLAIDPWNGVFTNTSLNFTTIAERLQKYIYKHTGKNIPIFFICGSDNARFCLSFIDSGNCVVILRPGYEDQFLKYKKYTNERIIFSDAHVIEMSSTKVRSEIQPRTPPKKLILRIENVEHSRVVPLLKKYGSFEDIQINYLKNQEEEIRNICNFNKTISLDSQISMKYNFGISRLFDLFGSNKLGFAKRPDHNHQEIPPGEYDLFDDDICSGKTISYAKEQLKIHNIQIKNTYSLTQSYNEEVLDARDFFINNLNNGLLISFKGKHSRVPYIYPFVCPLIRGSIENPYKFSIDIWKMNAVVCREYGNLKLKDCPWLNILNYQFNSEMHLTDICEHFADQLTLARNLRP